MDGGLVILLVFVGLSILDAMARKRRRQLGQPPEDQETDTAWQPEESEDGEEPEVRGYDSAAASETHADRVSQGRPRQQEHSRSPEPPAQRPPRSMIPPELWDEIASLAKGVGQGTEATRAEAEPTLDQRVPESTEVAWRTAESAPSEGPAPSTHGAVESDPIPLARSRKPAPAEGDVGAPLVARTGSELALHGESRLPSESAVPSAIPTAGRHSGSRVPLYTELFGAGDRASLRKAFVLKEVLGPPVAERPETE